MLCKPPLFRSLLLFGTALLVPGIPFVLFQDRCEALISQAFAVTENPSRSFLVVVALLSSDLLLPIPSSAVSTFAGSRLGLLQGTAAVWLGMTAGAMLGFLLARLAGPAVVGRLAAAEDVDRLRDLSARWGTAMLILTRPLPLLAEAAVVLAGSLKLSWWRFVLPVAVSNAALSVGYAWLGTVARQQQWTPLVLVLSLAVPLVVTLMVRRYLPRTDGASISRENE